MNITEAQAGGKKGKATVDHILRLKDTIKLIRQNKKPAYIAFLDVTKAYDKAWLDAILYVLHKEGTDLSTWKIIKELNNNLTATLKTKFGNTRKIHIKDSIRQGGVLSVIQYALLMDEINKEITRQNVGPKMNEIAEPIGCLLWMDDVALISNNPEELQKMLDITHEMASRYHIEFGTAKSKILKIGRAKDRPDLFLGTQILEYENTYKYLGETLNSKGNMEDHINQVKRKTEAAYQTILAIMGNQHFNKIELETAWKLLETCIQPIITYGGETWNLNKKEEKQMNQIQENVIRRILMVPQSTPKTTLYMETGLLDISTIVIRNRLNMEKRLQKTPESLTTKIMERNIKGGWKENTQKAKAELHLNENTLNRHLILEHFKGKINMEAQGKTKSQFLLDNKTWTPGERPRYMKEMTRKDASTIFKARSRMLDMKNNFKGKYRDTKCRKCNYENETQEHILQECAGIHENDSNKVNTQNIFEEDPEGLIETARKIENTLNELNKE